MLTNEIMWANMITRAAALVSLEFAIASAIYSAVYVWRITPARKNFPDILRHIQAGHASEYAQAWMIFALPITYIACSILLFAVAFLGFVWTSGIHGSVPQDISERSWPHLLLMVGLAHPLYQSFQAWETFNKLCEPVKVVTLWDYKV